MVKTTDERFREIGEACVEAGKAVERYLTEGEDALEEMLRAIAKMKVLMINPPWEDDEEMWKKYSKASREEMYKRVRKERESRENSQV